MLELLINLPYDCLIRAFGVMNAPLPLYGSVWEFGYSDVIKRGTLFFLELQPSTYGIFLTREATFEYPNFKENGPHNLN